ncbi:MAG: hypothetical protein EOP42_33715 [Sphingobacteriaceae bacterium]|nr:MAG: hypothetical protein EOP42_33715 [Sphingobacteriaceae bacterium]
MKKHLIILLLLFYILTSCSKKDSATIKNAEATIIFTGSVALDGCGYLVKINSTGVSYHADNLSETYQKDNLPVIISYHLLTTKFSCGLLSNNVSAINIDGIKNR